MRDFAATGHRSDADFRRSPPTALSLALPIGMGSSTNERIFKGSSAITPASLSLGSLACSRKRQG